ncbi:MAG: FlgD immunoglobulin-like domain containing protein [candidate division WOR-3 bacterium]
MILKIERVLRIGVFIFIAVIVGAEETTLIVPPFSHTLGINRVSSFHFNLYFSDFKIDDPQGIWAIKFREDDDTTTVRDDHILTILAVNSGQGQIVYNQGLLKIEIFGKKGSGEGEFLFPKGITAHRDNLVFVADWGNDRIVQLRYQGKKLHWDKVFFSPVVKPYGVAVDTKKNVYFTEPESSLIYVCDSLGNIIRVIKEDISYPTAIAVIDRNDPNNFYGEEFLAVVDFRNKRLQKFSLSGKLLEYTDVRGIGMNEAEFSYIAIDYYGNIFATDTVLNCIHKFDRFLNYLTSFGREGSGKGEFYKPRGITIARKYGQVFITEKTGGQYYWAGLDSYFLGFFPDSFTLEKPGTTIALYLTDISEVSLSIFDEKGNLVRETSPFITSQAGEVLIAWDGRDKKGEIVKPGKYQLKITCRLPYGGGKRFRKEMGGYVYVQ